MARPPRPRRAHDPRDPRPRRTRFLLPRVPARARHRRGRPRRGRRGDPVDRLAVGGDHRRDGPAAADVRRPGRKIHRRPRFRRDGRGAPDVRPAARTGAGAASAHRVPASRRSSRNRPETVGPASSRDAQDVARRVLLGIRARTRGDALGRLGGGRHRRAVGVGIAPAGDRTRRADPRSRVLPADSRGRRGIPRERGRRGSGPPGDCGARGTGPGRRNPDRTLWIVGCVRPKSRSTRWIRSRRREFLRPARSDRVAARAERWRKIDDARDPAGLRAVLRRVGAGR